MNRARLSALALAVALLASPFAAADWPQFRGPGGQGHAETEGLPLRWSETESVVWKTEIPGRGWSSPVIEGREVWLTTAVEMPASEEEKARRLEATTNNQPLEVAVRVTFHAVGIDRRSGEILHEVELFSEEDPQPVHTLNSFASPTPVIEDGRLYAHFGTFGTAAVDTREGKVIWTNRELRVEHENGPGSSPVLWRDRLIFHLDGSDVQSIVALRKRTGEVAWRTPRSGAMRSNPQYRKAYGTPLAVDVGAPSGRPHLLSPAADWLYAYDPLNGKELWRLSYETLGFSIVPRPVVGHGLAYIVTCYARSELLAVRYPRSGGPERPEIIWRHGRQVPYMSSPLLVGDEIYFVSDRGIATCLDARTGEERWQERLGGNHSASPLHADRRIYFFSREGVATVLRPGRRFEKLAENELDGRFFASPAAAGGALYLRTDRALYRIEERSSSE